MTDVLRVGLTGGIAAGKSVVTKRFAELGAVVMDADLLARQAVEPGTPGLAEVVAEFGPQILAPDGTLDRAALAAIVFADDERRRRLNEIVHPRVGELRRQAVAQASADAIVVEDIPLLVEGSRAAAYPIVVVVHAPQAERLRRLAQYRGMTEAEARARMAAQATDEQRRAAADVWIDNSGDVSATVAAVDELWHTRLVPFEANLRAGRPAPRGELPVTTDPTWPAQAERVMARIRRALRERLRRVEHVGPTAVPGARAEDLIELRVVVNELDPVDELAAKLAKTGLVLEQTGAGAAGPALLARNADPARAVDCRIWPEAAVGDATTSVEGSGAMAEDR